MTRPHRSPRSRDAPPLRPPPRSQAARGTPPRRCWGSTQPTIWEVGGRARRAARRACCSSDTEDDKIHKALAEAREHWRAAPFSCPSLIERNSMARARRRCQNLGRSQIEYGNFAPMSLRALRIQHSYNHRKYRAVGGWSENSQIRLSGAQAQIKLPEMDEMVLRYRLSNDCMCERAPAPLDGTGHGRAGEVRCHGSTMVCRKYGRPCAPSARSTLPRGIATPPLPNLRTLQAIHSHTPLPLHTYRAEAAPHHATAVSTDFFAADVETKSNLDTTPRSYAGT